MTSMTLFLWGSRFQVPSGEFINELLGYNLCEIGDVMLFNSIPCDLCKMFCLCYLSFPITLWDREVGNNCLWFFLFPSETHTWVARNLCPSLSSSFLLTISSQLKFKPNLFWSKTPFSWMKSEEWLTWETGYWLRGDIGEFRGMLERSSLSVGVTWVHINVIIRWTLHLRFVQFM